MKKLENILAENMRRFGTKNLSERNLDDLENKLGFDSGANRDPKTGNLINPDGDTNNNGYPDSAEVSTNNEMINIPQKYSALRNILGDKSSSNDIIKIYNERVVPKMDTIPLEVYEDGYFWNKVMDDIMVDTILSQLNLTLS
jgi:hypothetical protein